jgi:hypothetical protein
MSEIPTIEMKDLDDSLITIDEASKISGQNKLTVQKKFKEAKIQTVAMLKTGKAGRPSRLFKRSDFNAIYNISASPATQTENSSEAENNQNSIMASEAVSPSP